MEISSETREKFSKSAETIYKQGYLDGKSQKKNQSDVEKKLVRVAENVAKRVESNKNIPDEKKLRGLCSKFLENTEPATKDGLIRFASDFLATAGTLPDPAPKPKTQPSSA